MLASHLKKLENSMLLYRFHYSDKKSVLRTFNNKQEMEWFAHNEGDHLIKVELIDAGSSGLTPAS